ncbi:serine/threonine protein kinase [Arthrobacter sp. D1-29]
MQIKLDRKTWTRGPALTEGEGGFGKVYLASNAEAEDAVAKFVEKTPGATREMLIGEYLQATNCANVVPVLDSGEHENFWVIVMPRAEMSLAQRLAQPEPVELAECLKILDDVAQALVSLDGHVVHRDLKPANVLLLDGTWCLADFGTSRYTEAATAEHTWKDTATVMYAAPEQWLAERATAATDIYAFGVMAYEVVAGHLPFPGPSPADYREQHLKVLPPPLTGGTGRLRNIISECLNKAPEARPRAANILSRLQKSTIEPALAGIQKLANVNTEVVARRAQAHAEQRVLEDHAASRARLFASSAGMFESFAQPLIEAVEDNAPTASIKRGLGNGNQIFTAELMGAKLGLSRPKQEPKWDGPFDVIGSAVVSVVRQRPNSRGWLGRSHSLWFCDAHRRGQYGWYELAFMKTFFRGPQDQIEPFSLEPKLASDHFAMVMGTGQLAWPVTEVDRDDPSEFLNRWLGWFADAGVGTLGQPSTMPERIPSGSWRTK